LHHVSQRRHVPKSEREQYSYFANRYFKGFRSTSGRNVGILDAEFEAFQAGQPIENQFPELQPGFPYGGNTAFFPSSPAQHHSPNWASEFQKLHISSPQLSQPSLLSQPQLQQQAPQSSNLAGAWYQDLTWQQSQPSAQTRLDAQIYGGGSYMHDGILYGNNFPTFGQQHNLLSDPAMQIQSGQQAGAVIDDAAFESAFDAAHSRIQQLDDHMQQKEVKAATDVEMEEQLGQISHAAPMTEIPRIGADRITQQDSSEMLKGEGGNDADELARTASQLLDNLKHDQSRKFQESSFLSLMRQLRDREVRVEGDRLVEVSISYP